MEDIVDLFPEDKPGSSKKTVVAVGVMVALIGICVMVIAFYGLGPMLAKPTSNQVSSQSQDVSEVLGLNEAQQNVGSLPLNTQQLEQLLSLIQDQVQLPQDNTARAFQITDISQFKQNSFFAKAENGDVYIIFEPSKGVLLYSRLQQKIIESGQLQ